MCRNQNFVFTLFVLAITTVLLGGCGRKKSGSCMNPLAPGCGGGNTAEIQKVEVYVPNGGVIVSDSGNHAQVTVSISSILDLPDEEMVEINTAFSQDRDLLTHGRAGKGFKTVRDWKKENPIRMLAGHFMSPGVSTITYNYIHVLVFRGSGPEPWEISTVKFPGGVPISALRNLLAHEVLVQDITFNSSASP